MSSPLERLHLFNIILVAIIRFEHAFELTTIACSQSFVEEEFTGPSAESNSTKSFAGKKRRMHSMVREILHYH